MKDYNDKSGLAYYWLEENMGRVLLVILFACLGLWGLLLEGRDDLNLGQRLARGMGPELAGIVISAVTINALAERRQREELKAQLIRQMGSRHNEIADAAVRELAHHGWLYDGSLNKAYLEGANLKGVDLESAVLNRANLMRANLIGAQMSRACLNSVIFLNANLDEVRLNYAQMRSAVLDRADLGNATLTDADLSGADLVDANLKHCSLQNTNLSGVDFRDVNLREANMRGTNLTGIKNWTIDQLGQAEATKLSLTIMPDGIRLGHIIHDSAETQGRLTFNKWKSDYLAKYHGKETDLRDGQETSQSTDFEC